jgi:hypothetical protein
MTHFYLLPQSLHQLCYCESAKPKVEVSPSAKHKAKLESDTVTAKSKSNKAEPITARLLKSKNYQKNSSLKTAPLLKGKIK